MTVAASLTPVTIVGVTGRPLSFDPSATLETILEEFWRDGYARVTIQQLTAATGVKAPSLYATFGDKRQMFEKASARYIERLDAALERDLQAPTAREAIERLLTSAAHDFARAESPPGCLVMAEPDLANRRTLTRAAVRERLRTGHAAGEFDEDPDALGDFIDSVLAGMAARARDGASQTELINTATRAIGAFPGRRLGRSAGTRARQVARISGR